MVKLLVWVPGAGLGLMMVMLMYASLSQTRAERGKPDDREHLVLVLEDYEEQVEILVRWLQFRQRWLELPVSLTVAVTTNRGDTYKILERLHKTDALQIVKEGSIHRHTANQNVSVIKLDGKSPIPWGELEQTLRGLGKQAS